MPGEVVECLTLDALTSKQCTFLEVILHLKIVADHNIVIKG